ncbi:MAG: PH domain-containing protein [Halobacteriaceae archaeon]
MTRLHPLTVPIRVVNTVGSLIAVAVFSVVIGGAEIPGSRPVAVTIAGLGLLAVLGYQYAYYRRFEYALEGDTIDISSGVFSRQHREIPRGRVQNVDISQGIVQRVLGIAAVDFETAGGGSTEAKLRYVGVAEAQRIQDVFRGGARRSAGEQTAETEPGQELFALDQRALLVLSALSFDLRVFSAVQTVGAIASPTVFGLVFDGPMSQQLLRIGLAGVGLLLTGWLLGAAVTFTRYYGFRLSKRDDELRYERGLLQRYSGTIPLEKIQTLTVKENLFMRRFGYAALGIETAGYAGSESPGGGSEAAVPLERREDVVALARSLEPFESIALSRPPDRARRRYRRRYWLGTAILAAAVSAIVVWVGESVLWWAVPAGIAITGGLLAGPAARRAHRSRGYELQDGYIVSRLGWWRRRTTVVPDYRVQTVIDRRTVFQRRWSLATVEFDTAGSLSLTGPSAQAVDIDAEEAATVQATAASHLQEALRVRRRDRLDRGPTS